MRLSSAAQEVLKWLAFGIMTLDHVGIAFFEPWEPAYAALRLVGRLAWPLFAGLIAYNVAVRRVPWARWWPWLLGFGLVAQPVAVAFRGQPFMLNILFTLLAGVVVALAGMRWRVGWAWLFGGGPVPWAWLGLTVGALVALLLGPVFEYGRAGVLLVPVWALYWGVGNAFAGLALLVVIGLQNWGTLGVFTALLAPAVVWLVAERLPLPFVLRRPSRWLTWAYYPAHMALLVALTAFLGLRS